MNEATKQTRNLKSSKKCSCPNFRDKNRLLEVTNSFPSLMMLITTRHPNNMYAIKHTTILQGGSAVLSLG